jgi:uncharacterized membrane protein
MTEPGSNNADRAVAPKQPFISNYGLVLTVYILYLVGFLTGISVVIGVIIAYLLRDETDVICRSHFQFQITTFWIGLLFVFVGLLTIHFVIGGFIIIWWIIWTLTRCVKGLLFLNKGSAIPDPNSWWFGE